MQNKNNLTLWQRFFLLIVRFIASFNGYDMTVKEEEVKHKPLFAFFMRDKNTGHEGIIFATNIGEARQQAWLQAIGHGFKTAPKQIFCKRAKSYDGALTVENFLPMPGNVYDKRKLKKVKNES
jgi:hypothetical protein